MIFGWPNSGPEVIHSRPGIKPKRGPHVPHDAHDKMMRRCTGPSGRQGRTGVHHSAVLLRSVSKWVDVSFYSQGLVHTCTKWTTGRMGEHVAKKTADDLPAVPHQGRHRPVFSDDRAGSRLCENAGSNHQRATKESDSRALANHSCASAILFELILRPNVSQNGFHTASVTSRPVSLGARLQETESGRRRFDQRVGQT